MTISENLFRAILAMDAYNRGYNNGVVIAGSSLGNANLLTIALPPGFEAASFFAQAYSLNGRVIISYRGTDALGSDILSYPVALGVYDTQQSRMAAEVYQTIAASTAPEDIVLTGHSLGGGLAGLIGGLYGSAAKGF